MYRLHFMDISREDFEKNGLEGIAWDSETVDTDPCDFSINNLYSERGIKLDWDPFQDPNDDGIYTAKYEANDGEHLVFWREEFIEYYIIQSPNYCSDQIESEQEALTDAKDRATQEAAYISEGSGTGEGDIQVIKFSPDGSHAIIATFDPESMAKELFGNKEEF